MTFIVFGLFPKGFNSSLNLSITEEERVPTMRYSMDWTEVQEQLSKDLMNLSIAVKSSQANLVNRILSNLNYAPDRYALFSFFIFFLRCLEQCDSLGVEVSVSFSRVEKKMQILRVLIFAKSARKFVPA